MSRDRRPPTLLPPHTLARVAIGAIAILVAGQVAMLPAANAASAELSPAPAAAASFVDLGTASTYSILAGAGVANTGAGTVLSGDLGLSPTGVISGFPPGTLKGTIHDKDPAAEAAQADRQAAYEDAAGQLNGTAFAGDQGGKTFTPGVYTSAAAFTNTGTMTLDANGDSSAVFVFQIGAAFSTAAATKIVLTDGALANNVYWQVAGAISVGAGAKLVGTFLGAGAIAFGEGASIKGRALTPSTVAVTNSPFTEPIDDFTAPLVSVDGGAARSTNDTTPPISGTTDEPSGRLVTVTVGGQTLRATVRALGAWSVSANTLSSGPHEVVASISDGSQNTGTASQLLRVDVKAPVVSIDGGARSATKDVTPSISGRTDEPIGRAVNVTVGGQTLRTTVRAGGTWSVDAKNLAEDHYIVTASVKDGAKNIGTAHQVLSVDLTLPVVTIDGGAKRSTNDTSPWVYGTTAEKAGTTVHVTIGGQNLAATVLTGGTWGVSATTLPTGTHRVVASITDAADNTGTAAQMLTISGGEPEVRYQPDASIRPKPGQFVGVGSYAAADQRVTKRLKGATRTATFEVRLTNRGDATDRMTIRGTPRSREFRVTYLAGDQDITPAMTAGTYRTNQLAPGRSVRLTVKVTRTKAAGRGDTRRFDVRSASSHAPASVDIVGAIVRVGGAG